MNKCSNRLTGIFFHDIIRILEKLIYKTVHQIVFFANNCVSCADRFGGKKKKVKQIRTHLGLTQRQFADRIGKTIGYFSSIGCGKAELSPRTIQDICDAYGVNPDFLTGESEMMFSEEEGISFSRIDKEGISSRIREIREGITQAQFAEIVGCSLANIKAIESGKRNPSPTMIKKMAMKMNVSEDWLLTGKGEKERKEIKVDDVLISWLSKHPEVILELWERM